jgi:uncharacterized repeat protein (TIGR01451 family)/CSLREA domain-containing protein
MSRHAPRRTSLLFPLVLATLAACQDSTPTAPRPLSHPQVRFAQGDNNTWTVNSLADPGNGVCDDTECTLREAIAAAASGATITFASGLEGSIVLGFDGELWINSKDLTIDGAGRITLDGENGSRVLKVTGPEDSETQPTLKLTGIRITRGTWDDGGGGIYASWVNLVLDRVAVSGNKALAAHGGGIYLRASGATITASMIDGNVAMSDPSLGGGKGGGIYVDEYSALTLMNSTVDGNIGGTTTGTGQTGGGGIYNAGTATIGASTISKNSTLEAGGGLRSDFGSSTRIVASTLSGNGAAAAGAISNGGSLELLSSTVTLNGSSNVALSTSRPATVGNSIIAGNKGLSDCGGSFVSVGHNLTTTTGNCGFAATGDVAVLSAQVFTQVLEEALVDNGGLTKTHALISRGLAVDKGYCPGETKDQRDFTRPADDPLVPNAADACDIGAYELQGPVAAVADLMISQAVDKPSAKQGDKVTYTVRVQNLGPQTAPSVVVNDILSSGTTFVEARANRGSLQAPPKGETGTVTWTLGDLLNGANEAATITVTVIIKGKTTITNTASVTGAVADPNAANNSASIAVTVGSGGTTKGGPKH